MSFSKIKRLRSEKHRRNVAALGCLLCGAPAQCAHANFGKGLSLKACDSQTFPLCPPHHTLHDSGAIYGSKQARRIQEVIYVDKTRAELISRSLWTSEIETAYRLAYEPMKRASECLV